MHPIIGLILSFWVSEYLSSLLFSSILLAQRHRGTPCLGSEWDQGVKGKQIADLYKSRESADSANAQTRSMAPVVLLADLRAEEMLRRRASSEEEYSTQRGVLHLGAEPRRGTI